MSVLAVKDYIQNTVVANIAIPSQVTLWTAIKGYRQMPDQQKLGATVAVVLVNYADDEHRVTTSRGFGSKEITYEFGTLIIAEQSSPRDAADQFDIIAWTIQKAFRTAATSLNITDPITAETSWLHKIGEHIRGNAALPELLADAYGAGGKMFTKNLRIEVKEWIQA